MSKENPTHNPIAAFLGKSSVMAQKEFPVIAEGAAVLAIICILVSVQWINVPCMATFAVLTIAKTAFQAGMVWQRVCRKER